MRSLITISLFFIALQSHAQFLRVDFTNNQDTTLYGEEYVIASHATSFWDRSGDAKTGTKNLIRWGRENRIPIIGSVHGDALIHKEAADLYYFTREDIDYLMVSEAGQHKIHFENAQKIFFAGGNLTLCLCEAIRDVVRNNRSIYDSHPLNIYLVRDAIYDWQMKNAPDTASDVDTFITSNVIPNFRCPNQNWYNFPNVDLDRVRLDTYLDQTLLKSYDLEPTDLVALKDLSYLIRVYFIHSRDLDKYR